MYKLKNTIVRSIVAIIIGIVLIKWPRLAPNMIIIIIGILFIIPGIVTLINYWIRKSKEGMKLPSYILIESTGSILLGLCMALIPEFFTAFFMYCLGFLLVLGGILLYHPYINSYCRNYNRLESFRNSRCDLDHVRYMCNYLWYNRTGQLL